MKFHTRAVHAGDRQERGKTRTWVPVTAPIQTATSYFYDDPETLDDVFEGSQEGHSYQRYGSPTVKALEELVTSLETGEGALACSSGMAALHIAINAALVDRPRRILAFNMLYGATINMLAKHFNSENGATTEWLSDIDEAAIAEHIKRFQPGVLLMESVANPLLRVPALDRIAEMARSAGIPFIVDNTFATPMIMRPIEFGATYVVHSLTKYLSGHGDVMGGIVVAKDSESLEPLRILSRVFGSTLGPFESYLAMRGIKTFPIRMKQQCSNATQVAQWLQTHPAVEKVHFPADPNHPDHENIKRLFAEGLYGGIVSFELRNGSRQQVFDLMRALKLIVPATSLGDVHSMMLYPAMASHRDISPKHRERLNIHDNLVRFSAGIEDPEDIIADLDQALHKSRGFSTPSVIARPVVDMPIRRAG